MASERVHEEEEKKDTTHDETKPFVVTPSSPYHLGSSDNPGTPLVAVPLVGDNYRNWSRSIRTALCAKTKLGFVDGTIKKPAETAPEFDAWDKADSMVTAWIINSINPTLHGSISHAATARDVDLEERFSQTNAPRIHQLWRTLSLFQQEPDIIVTEYYSKFKEIMDELSEQQPLPKCTCGASKNILQREEDNHVHLFLGGLDADRFVHIKGTILNTDPLPSLRKVFNHILREEARLNADKNREVK